MPEPDEQTVEKVARAEFDHLRRLQEHARRRRERDKARRMRRAA